MIFWSIFVDAESSPSDKSKTMTFDKDENREETKSEMESPPKHQKENSRDYLHKIGSSEELKFQREGSTFSEPGKIPSEPAQNKTV